MHIYFDVGPTMINSLSFHFDKNNLKFIFILFKTKSYTEKVWNISKSPIETYRKYTFCVHIIGCACPYSSNIGLSAMTLYYPVQDKTTSRPVNTQNYYTKI